MSNVDKIAIGDKYYKVLDDDSVDIFRVSGTAHDKIKISRGINNKKVGLDYFKDYTKINPDGFIFFNIVNMGPTEQEGQDVLVTLNRKDDIKKHNGLPYIGCRQNIFDLYSNPTNNTNSTILAMSMTVDTVPEGSNYEDILACHSVDYFEKVSVYLEDTLDEIISLVDDIGKFDKVLWKMYNNMKDSEFTGLNKDLKSLLYTTHFEYDFKRAYDIHQVDFEIKIVDDGLTYESKILLEGIVKEEIIASYALPYDKEINLAAIERKYVLVSDVKDKLYVVAYDSGEYVNRPYDDMGDKTEVIELIRQIKK